MLSRRYYSALPLALLLFTGCSRQWCKKQCGPLPAAYPVRPGGPVTGQPFMGAQGNIPPTNIPTIDPARSNFASPRPNPEILLPDRMPQGSPMPQGPATLLKPETEPANPRITESAPKAPPASTFPQGPASSALPVGIADFAQVKTDVTAGLKPDLDGLTWLKQHGFKTILYLKKPSDDDAADRRLVERHGMTFLSLSVAPETLTATQVEEFNRIVGDSQARPLFVYDRDGSLAGGLWYLHFRTSELLTDDEARVRAGRLGLREKGSPDQMAMWLAVQKYLEQLSK